MKMRAVGQPFDGGDGATLHLAGKGHAREAGRAVNVDGTTTAGSHVATLLDAKHPQIISKDIEEDGVRWMRASLISVDSGGPDGPGRVRHHRYVDVPDHDAASAQPIF